VAGSFLIGFLLGWVVPAAYRESLKEDEENRNLIEGVQRQIEQVRAARESRKKEMIDAIDARFDEKDTNERRISTEPDLETAEAME
jgi:hypothetical protein